MQCRGQGLEQWDRATFKTSYLGDYPSLRVILGFPTFSWQILGVFINWEEGKNQHCPGPLPAADMRGGCAAGLSLSSGEQGSSPPSRGELLTPCGRAADFPGIMQGRFCRGSSFASLREYPDAP